MVYAYTSESAMYPVLYDYLRDQNRFVCTQVPVRSYRADFISFQVDWAAVRDRLNRGYFEPIESAPLWRTLLAVKRNREASVADISGELRLSSNYTRSLLAQLDRLELLQTTSDRVRLLYWPDVLYHNLHVVEAKLTDWKRAVIQSARYTQYATECYVALPQRLAETLADKPPLSVSRSGVGIMAVNGSVEVVRPSDRFDTVNHRVELYLLNEYLWKQIVLTLRRVNSPGADLTRLPANAGTLPSDLPMGVL